MDALDFLKQFDDESVDGVLYDPPYSPRQVAECYHGVGREVTMETTQSSFWSRHKAEMARIVKRGGRVLSFGWNSFGVGKKNGFEMTRILLVAHGGNHNDTICTSERKFGHLQLALGI
jgi:predicted methyltransferase